MKVEFNSQDTLAHVHDSLLGVEKNEFTFVAIPRRKFTLQELPFITLKDAGLVPRSVLIVESLK